MSARNGVELLPFIAVARATGYAAIRWSHAPVVTTPAIAASGRAW
jgi:hypothetical protein